MENHERDLVEGKKAHTERFDKNILFVSSGALIVSFAFIKDIVPCLDCALNKWSLITSWCIFSSIIFISLLSIYRSMQAHTWALNNSHLEDNEFNYKILWMNGVIRILNQITIALIPIGAFFLLLFITTNIL